MKVQYQDSSLVIFESALFRTTCSLIIRDNYILLVDPNWLPIEIDFIQNWVQEQDAKKKKYILFTHSDYDHIIGYGKFLNYQSIASQNFIDNQDPRSILTQINTFDDENYIKRDYEISYPKIDIPIGQDEMSLTIHEDEYLFYQARGHNKDGIITYNKSKKILIVGDYLSNIEFPYIYDSVKEYKNTLNKLKHIILTQKVDMLICGHGDYTADKQEMLKRIQNSSDYISSLEKSILNDTPFDIDGLLEKYNFPIIMRKFQNANLKLIRQELNKN